MATGTGGGRGTVLEMKMWNGILLSLLGCCLIRNWNKAQICEISSEFLASSWRVPQTFVSMTKRFMNHVYWSRKKRLRFDEILITKLSRKARKSTEKIGHYKLGNKNIKQHDILYWCYQFTQDKDRCGRDNKPQRGQQKKNKKNHRKILEMRNLLKMEHSFICVLQEPRWEPTSVVKTTKNQENYKRGNVSRLNILFVFLYFPKKQNQWNWTRRRFGAKKK